MQQGRAVEMSRTARGRETFDLAHNKCSAYQSADEAAPFKVSARESATSSTTADTPRMRRRTRSRPRRDLVSNSSYPVTAALADGFEETRRRVSPSAFASVASTILAGRSLGRVQFLKRCGMTA
jgi:hypothetical protein